jgi:RNA polymerase sigma factor (sigma-70 family)
MNSVQFVQQFNNFQDKLKAFALKLTRDPEAAKDLLQETALRAYDNRDKFKAGTNFRGWVTTIMRNTFINAYRRNKRRKTIDEPLEVFLFAIENKNAISNSATSRLAMEELEEMFDEIGDNYSVPFLMFFSGYQYDEIAQHMNIPMGTVKSRIFFARKKLKAMIAERYN